MINLMKSETDCNKHKQRPDYSLILLFKSVFRIRGVENNMYNIFQKSVKK